MKSIIIFSQGFFPYMDKLEFCVSDRSLVSHMAVSQNTKI